MVMPRGQAQLLHSESSERIELIPDFGIHTPSPSNHVMLFQHQHLLSQVYAHEIS
jgi:hypothetical protein